jgi:AcrR family transcriptional regulator
MPAGRPPDPELVERLLDVATDLFYRHGIRAVGVDEIAERSGVAKRSLYRHFRKKDDLIAAVIRRRDQRWRNEFFAAVRASSTSPKARILAAFDLLGETCRSKGFRGCPFINAAIELADARHAGHAAVAENKRATHAFFVELLRDAGVASPDAVGDEFMLLFNGALVNCALESDDTPSRRAKEAARRLIR